MQQIKLIQRNFSTSVKSFKGVNTYVTVPEKLVDFQNRVNCYLKEGWRVFSVIPESINNASCMIIVLVRDDSFV